MAWELESLVSNLLCHISCAGEQGCAVSELHSALNRVSSNIDFTASRPLTARHCSDGGVEHEPWVSRMTSTLWSWLADRSDVSVGKDRMYNHVPLSELLVLQAAQLRKQAGQSQSASTGDSNATANPGEIRVFTSEEVMWESITGHSIDHKRVPRLEWLLLLGIASSQSGGILQGDLCRLVGQDKRSVPKRTDALLSKGYIVKRTTLVRGTKTSKLWLRRFAPYLPQDGEEPLSQLSFTRHVLVDTLDPVPWHTRWTGVSIEYRTLAITIMAITKEWEVMRLQDLKAKLGVLGMRWQMKVVAKTLRTLSKIGVIQYVAAKLEDRVFRDCIKYVRELTPRDLSAFLATGKRGSKNLRFLDASEVDAEESLARSLADDGALKAAGNNNDSNGNNNNTFIQVAPWAMDKPLQAGVAQLIQQYSDRGMTNPELYALTIGSTFSRYLSTTTAARSNPDLQPQHLKYLQISSEPFRHGKVAFYRYSMRSLADSVKVDDCGSSQSAQEGLGFSTISSHNKTEVSPAPFTELIASSSNSRNRQVRQPSLVSDAQTRSKQSILARTRVLSRPLSVSPGAPVSKRARVVTLRLQPDRLRSTISALALTSTQPDSGESVASQGHSFGNAMGSTDDQHTPLSTGLNSHDDQSEHIKPEHREVSTSRPWRCSLCGGSWKNDLGLKYHREKSRTTCNPSYDATAAASRLRGRKPIFPTSGRRTNSARLEALKPRFFQEEVGIEASAAASDKTLFGLRVQKPRSTISSSETRDEQEKAPVTPALRAENTIQIGDSRVGNVEVRPGSNPLMRSEGRLPSYMPSLRASPSVGVRNTPSLKAEFLHDRARPSSIRERQAQRSLHKAETLSLPRLVTGGLKAIRTGTAEQSYPIPSTSRVLGPKADPHKWTIGEKIRRFIEEQLDQSSGFMIGGATLLTTATNAWDECFTGEDVPSTEDVNNAVKEAVKAGTVVEHWHGFRLPNGVFDKVQVIARPKVDAFSKDAMRLVDEFKDRRIKGLGLINITASKNAYRGRRQLARQIAVLKAPVYASQVASQQGDSSPVEDGAGPFKRHKASPGTLRKRPRSSQLLEGKDEHRTTTRVRWAAPSRAGHWIESTLAELARSGSGKKPLADIRFLTPNTFLEEDGPSEREDEGQDEGQEEEEPQAGPELSLARENTVERDKRGSAIEAKQWGDIVFAPSRTLSEEYAGVWPSHSTYFFEKEESFSLEGWLPNRDWVRWEAFPERVESRAAALICEQKSAAGVKDGWKKEFWSLLQACVELELSWSDMFVQARPRDAGPHVTYVQLFASAQEILGRQQQTLVWNLKDQLGSRQQDIGESNALYIDTSESDGDSDFYEEILHMSATQTTNSTSYSTYQDVALTTRSLTQITLDTQSAASSDLRIEGYGTKNDWSRQLAAFIAIRVLLGGAEKAIDWGLLLKIFPQLGLRELRRFWLLARREYGSYISKITRDFQDRYLEACMKDEVSMVNFDEPLGHDWNQLIDWTILLMAKEYTADLPATSVRLDRDFDRSAVESQSEDWRETYFHPPSSVFARFEAVCGEPGAISLAYKGDKAFQAATISDLDVARSWIRSLATTNDGHYSLEVVKKKLAILSKDSPEKHGKLLRSAVEQLAAERVICRSQKSPQETRPYRFNEAYTYALAKLAQRSKYVEAGAFKRELDSLFRHGATFTMPYTTNDGAVMALTSLHAAGRVSLGAASLPDVPLGFVPGSYESRKYAKSHYYFDLEVAPTGCYMFDEDIKVLENARLMAPPSQSQRGEIPQWLNFFGEPNARKWADIMGGFLFAYATRGAMTVEATCSAMKPVLEAFEVPLITQWGLQAGVLQPAPDGIGTSIGEWWWLAVAQMIGRT